MNDQKPPEYLKAIRHPNWGDHLCHIYENKEAQLGLAVPFIKSGLEMNEKCLYILRDSTAKQVSHALAKEGVNVREERRSGRLAFVDSEERYLKDGYFSPKRMLSLLEVETERALQEGYLALRATGEMGWALEGRPGSEQLMEYEARVNEFLSHSKCIALCQYDRRRFDPQVLLDALCTHPVVIIGTEIHKNLYYIPTAEFLSPDRPAAILYRWVESLSEHKRAEQALKSTALQMLEAVSTIVEAEDPYTAGHSTEVTNLALAIAKRMGLGERELDTLHIAGPLHDLGKIGIPGSVLNKPAKLTQAEWIMVRSHSTVSAQTAGRVTAFQEAVPVIRHHHERWDGKGYPAGLKAEDIPLLARILAVADAFEAMTSERPYRRARAEEEALLELERGAGTQWDPKVVETFLGLKRASFPSAAATPLDKAEEDGSA